MDENSIIEELKKRFFKTRTQGNQSFFMDIDTGETDLGISNIIGVLYAEGHKSELINKVAGSLKDQLLPICKSAVYMPKSDPTVVIKGLRFLNLWKEPEVQPSDAKCKPFLDHLLAAMGNQDKVDYFLDWLATRFQKPNDKKPHAVVYLYHAEGGNGKSLLAGTLQNVFGESAVQIASEAKMNSGSKVQLWARTLLIAEEASVKRGSDIYDTIKTYSGTDEIIDDIKHGHFKKHKIPATLLMLSNNAPNFLEPHDRRFFVSEWRIDLDKDAKAKYFKDYADWLKKEGGFGAIAGFLSRRKVDRDMYAPVPITEEKERAMSVGQDGCVREILDALEDEPNAHVFDADDFEGIFKKHDVKTSQIKHKLTEAGLKRGERLVIGGNRMYPWHRIKDKIVSISGVGSFIEVDGKRLPLEQKVRLKSKEYCL